VATPRPETNHQRYDRVPKPKLAAVVATKANDAKLKAKEAEHLARVTDPEYLRAQAAELMAEAEQAAEDLVTAQASAATTVVESTGALEGGYTDALAKLSAFLDAVEAIQLKLRPADEAARQTARRLVVPVPARPEPFATRKARDRSVADLFHRAQTERYTW
jgi:hypothetical protein